MHNSRSFIKYLSARTFSTFGDILVSIAVPFAVLDTLHGGSLDVGIVLAAELIGTFAFILVGGVLADRVSPIAGMIRADMASLVIQLVIAGLLSAGVMTVPLFAALALFKGIASGFFQPAARSLLPRIVEQEDLNRAVGLLGATTSVAMVLGPLIAGLLIVAVGPPCAIAVDALTFGLSAALLSKTRATGYWQTDEPEDPTGSRTRPSFVAELRGGLGEVLRRKWLFASIAAGSVTALLGTGPLLTAMPIAVHLWYGGAASYSWLVAGLAAGGILGGLVASRIAAPRPLLVAALVLPGLAAAPITLAGSAPIQVVIVGFGVAGLAQTLAGSLWSTGLCRAVPLEVLGRVSAWDGFTALGLRPLGQVLGGAFAGAFGIGSVLWMTAAIFIVMPLPLLALDAIRAPLVQLERHPTAA